MQIPNRLSLDETNSAVLTLIVEGDQDTGCFLTLSVQPEERPRPVVAPPSTVDIQHTHIKQTDALPLSILHVILEHLHYRADSEGHIRLRMQGELDTFSRAIEHQLVTQKS